MPPHASSSRTAPLLPRRLPSGAATATQGLLDYLFLCCQVRYGGMRDKPGKGRDYYHTCYCLSGLAVASAEPPNDDEAETSVPKHWTSSLELVNPVFNIVAAKVESGMAYYRNKEAGRGKREGRASDDALPAAAASSQTTAAAAAVSLS